MSMTTMGLLQNPPTFSSSSSSSSSIFRGRGMYQLHLVKADAIRPFIPSQLRIVETLGYTMGGFMLSTYEHSPFGPFHELVMLSGIVDHKGSSLAWTGKVLVSSDEVCQHSRKEFGVATEVAKFSKESRTRGGFLNINGLGTCNYEDIKITENNSSSTNIITIQTPEASEMVNISRCIIPRIKLSLTSLSGLTEYNPSLLQYTCNFETRLRVVSTAKISNQIQMGSDNSTSKVVKSNMCSSNEVEEGADAALSTTLNMNSKPNQMIDIVIKSQPILAFEFDSMKMLVDSPTLVVSRP